MDTLALNLNLGTVAAPAATGAEGVPPESTENTGPLDFAQLLAAGLDIAQAPAPPQSDTATTLELAATPEPLPDTLAAVAQGMPQLALQSIPAPVTGPTPDARTAAAPDTVGQRPDQSEHATSIAAKAAILAAATGESEGKTVAAESDQQIDQRHVETAFRAEIAKRESEQLLTTHDHRVAETAAAALQLAPVVERPAAPQATALLEIGAPVSGPGFADALSRQVVWMVDKDAQVAELRINPPELGPVEVRLTLAGDEASAQFFSAHAEVRNAIESSLGRLREAMAQAGIQLGDATVSAESFRDQSAAQEGRREGRFGYRSDQAPGTPNGLAGSARHGIQRGLIDVFA